MPNKNTRGGPWTPQQISAVWAKGRIVPGVNPNQARKDAGGAWIELLNYGQTNENGSGWEIDHIKPVSKGGGDELDNLQPLQWENNRAKGDSWPNWSCAKVAKD